MKSEFQNKTPHQRGKCEIRVMIGCARPKAALLYPFANKPCHKSGGEKNTNVTGRIYEWLSDGLPFQKLPAVQAFLVFFS